MTEKMTAEQIQLRLEESPFIRFLGLAVVALDHDGQTISMRASMRPEFERAKGSGQWHGGVIASIIDTVGDYALVMTAARGVPTINFRTDYLRPAVNTTLTATAEVRRFGRSVGVVDIDVVDDDMKLVAIGRGCYSL